MELYWQKEQATVYWPEPLERGWHLLGGDSASELAPKLPHLGLADILFLTSVMSIPRPQRRWGMATWLSTVFGLSRPALYDLADRVQQRLLGIAAPTVTGGAKSGAPTVVVTNKRVARTVLTAAVAGKSPLRPTQQLLGEAFGQSRSTGWLNEQLLAAGWKAGQLLRQVDTSPLAGIMAARDETFFHGQPLLLVIDPLSTTILLAEVATDRQAETWGAALLVAQEQGATFNGLVEDMARMYPKSQQEADLALEVQKDVWHVQRDGGRVRQTLERAALRATKQVLQLEKQLLAQWDAALFLEKYIPAVAQEERRYDQHAAFCEWFSHLQDALELVDWRSGEIRDRVINSWLLEEVVTALEQLDHPAVQQWLRTLRRHQAQLLTGLGWLTAALQPYRQQLAHWLPDPIQQERFLRTVARCWRLRQALTNQQTQFRPQAHQAEADCQALLADDPQRQQLADQLWSLLDAASRTSSLIECINGLLKQFLHAHRAFRNPETLQLYLNLFTLWHNMRVFERGKRQGKSPYQWAGIDPGSDDWLALLGFPAD